MSILKRLHNLWRLSGYEVPDGFNFYHDKDGDLIFKGYKGEPYEIKKMAQIVKMKQPLDKFLEENK